MILSKHRIFSMIILSLKQLKQNQRITHLDNVLFLRQLAALISAGIPILSCCDILEKSQGKTALRLMIYSIKRHILTGQYLHHGMRLYPQYFSELTCQLIQIGEHTGKLDVVLTSLAHEQETHFTLKRRIKQALFYPFCIIITAFLMTIFLFIFVIPHFAELFSEQRELLPWFTLYIFSIAIFLNHHILLFLIFFILLIAFIFFHGKKTTKLILKNIACFLPPFRYSMQTMTFIRFIKNLILTLTAGLTITDALRLTAHSCGNVKFAQAVLKLRTKISSGIPLHYAMQSLLIFPDCMIQMIKIGEESGTMEAMLEKISAFLEADIEQTLSFLSQMLEPLLMVILGVLIGGLLVGLYLPIFKLGSAI